MLDPLSELKGKTLSAGLGRIDRAATRRAEGWWRLGGV